MKYDYEGLLKHLTEQDDFEACETVKAVYDLMLKYQAVAHDTLEELKIANTDMAEQGKMLDTLIDKVNSLQETVKVLMTDIETMTKIQGADHDNG